MLVEDCWSGKIFKSFGAGCALVLVSFSNLHFWRNPFDLGIFGIKCP